MSARTPWQLYFITDARRRYVKIGLSRDAARRLNDLQAGSPLRLRIDLILHDCDRRDEERLHHAYACHWRHREWFDYPTELKARVDAALIAGEWSWEGIPARRSAYDSSFGGFLSRYDMLAAIKAEPGI